MRTIYQILVTYGTQQDHEYARTRRLRDAEALKEAAIRHKYTDAKVVATDAKSLKEAREKKRRGKARKGGPNKEARPVHDLQGRTKKPSWRRSKGAKSAVLP